MNMKLLLSLCIGLSIFGTYSTGAAELSINENPLVEQVKLMDQPTPY